MEWGNLRNWLSGGTRADEFARTREAWSGAELAWRNSTLGRSTLEELVVQIVREVMDRAERLPAWPILLALAEGTEDLLRLEEVGPIEADWPVIEGDPAVAIQFRQMVARRHRWASNFDRLFGVVRRQVVDMALTVIAALPEGCFGDWDEGSASFEVPLIELLDRPAEVVEKIMFLPYDDDAFRYEVFHRLREQTATNMVVASGFSPPTNPHDVADRLIIPTRQRGKSGRELTDAYLAHTPFARLLDLPVPFHVPDQMRFEHCHIIGGTGHGKTQLLQRMIHGDLVAAQRERRSVVVIDSQGDLINKLTRLRLFDLSESDTLGLRLVVIDPADVEFPAALNLFDAHLARLKDYRPVDRERVLNGVVELYEVFFGALLGAELTQKQGVIFAYLARLMITIPGATVHTLMQLMEDGRPFKSYMEAIGGSAAYFFANEFFHPSFSATKKQILKRLWGVLSTPAFERMFAQRENKLDLFEALQDGKIILINTAKDLLKEEGSQLFGRFFIALLAQAALERSTIGEDERTPTTVYVDEAQEYFDDRIETILTQARKYKVGITLAHQTLDQLSPRLRAAIHANTSFKCAGGVSARDARALADELHTPSDFIESMRRRQGRTEFAAWLKNYTPTAIRLSVQLGYLERQPTLDEDAYDGLLERNRVQYCGMLADVPVLGTPLFPEPQEPTPTPAPVSTTPSPELKPQPAPRPAPTPMPSAPERELGKGGPKHRYLQSLVKDLAEQQGFRATIEAPLPSGGQADVLLTRGELVVAVEVSVSTPVEWERENVRKCLAAGASTVVLVLAKAKGGHARYATSVTEGLSPDERGRVTCLVPEELPDFIAALVPPPDPSENVVKGYKVKVSMARVSPEDAKARRDALARVISKSMRRHDE
jgi:hypothetical protein